MYLALQNKKGNKELGGLKKKKEKKNTGREEKTITFHIMIAGVCANCIYIT